MSETGRRPLLKLKPTSPTAQPEPESAATWKCRPCGAAFALPTIDEPEWVRCPACNARLGRLADFQAQPPLIKKLRARAAAQRPKKTVKKPTPGKVQVWRRRASSRGLRRDAKDAPEA